MSEESRRFPSVDKLARSLDGRWSEAARVKAAREAVAKARAEGGAGDLTLQAEGLAARYGESSMRGLVNMSGVVLHTGLGRARLAKAAADRVAEVAAGHAVVEFDLETGERGDRQDHVRWLLTELTGAEDALVVNNCAGALVLALSALCAGREVVLSRGQMVEIGGAFRMPDIIRQSGCRLVECGCTNKTYRRDFEEVSGEETAAWLQCHQSNFAMTGFVSFPSASELAEGAHRAGALFLDDLGSGCLVDTRDYGLPKERTLGDAVRDGADLVMASGDKLLGGPQAGILVGRRSVLDLVKRHPLARALRCDKLTLAGLEATLRLYFEGREREIPVWRAVGREADEVRSVAEVLAGAVPGGIVEEGRTELGGGSFPGVGVRSWVAGFRVADLEGVHRRMRMEFGVVGRIEQGLFWLDPRTAESEEVDWTVQSLKRVFE